MSVQDARRSVAATRAKYSDRLIEAADALDAAAKSFREEAAEVNNSDYIEKLSGQVAEVMLRLRDLAVVDTFLAAVMKQVER